MKRIFGLLLYFFPLLTAAQALTGVKNIPGDYASISAAFTALNANGVGAGGVEFRVAADTIFYERPPVLTARGTASNPIVFRRYGSGKNPVIIPDSAGSSSPSNYLTPGDGILLFYGVQYLTWDGIDIEENNLYYGNTGSLTESGIIIGRTDPAIGVKHLAILNTRIKLQPGYVASKCIHISDKNLSGISVAPTSLAGSHQNITIKKLYSDSTFSGVMKFSNANVTNRAWDDDSLSVDSCRFIALGGNSGASTALGFHANEHLKTLSITNNYFEGSTSSSAEITAISVGSIVNSNVTITNNRIQNLYGRLSMIGIYCASGDRLYGASTKTIVQGNVIRKCSTNFSAWIVGIRCQGNPSSVNILNNSLDSILGISSSPTWNAILVSGSPDTIRVKGNTIRDFHLRSQGDILKIQQQSVHSVYIEDNIIDRCSAWGQLHGIWTNNATSQFWNFEGNTITNLSVTSTYWIYAIYAQGNGTVHYHRNRISNINGYQVFGIYAYRNTTTNYIYNNLIHSLNANYGAVGICLGQPANYNIYHNTVYLDVKNPSSASFKSACLRMDFNQSSDPVDMQNNVFVNRSDAGLGSGFSAVLNMSSSPQASFTSTTGNNNYYTGGTTIKNPIFIQATSFQKITLEDYLSYAGPKDQSSFSELSPFLDTVNQPYNLNLDTAIATQIESGGDRISSPIQVYSDFNGNPRSGSKADVGAFEGSYTGTDRRSPSMMFSPLSSGLIEANRMFSPVVIKDESAIKYAAGDAPRIYYKKTSEVNSYASNDSSTLGWKWTEATRLNDSSYAFNLDYSKLNTSLQVGDSIVYFLIASDSSMLGNVRIDGANAAYRPSSVNLSASHFPVTGMIYSYVIKDTVGGTYTVGVNGDFLDFTSDYGAFRFLEEKLITSPVYFKVISDINEPGTHALNPLERYQDIPHQVTISPDTAITRRLYTSYTSQAMIRLVSCEHVSIDGSYQGEGAYLKFEMQALFGGSLIHLSRNSNWPENNAFNTIKNCHFSSSTSNATVKGVVLGYNPSPDNIHDIEISRNYFYNIGMGVDVGGSYASLIRIRNIRIAKNKFGRFEYGGVMRSFPIKVAEAMEVEIVENEFNEIHSSKTIWISSGVIKTKILNNRIQNFGINQNEAAAIQIVTKELYSDILIANNFIWGMQTIGYLGGTPFGKRCAGIDILKSGTDLTGGVSIVHNTINLDGSVNRPSGYKSSAIYSDNPFQLKIVNNIISNTRKNLGGGSHTNYAVEIGAYWDTGIHMLDYNVMYLDSGGIFLNLKNINYTNLPSLKSAFPGDFDKNAFCDPIFYTPTNLRAVASCIYHAGRPEGITHDIFNQVRSVNTPSIGAYEYIEYPHDLIAFDMASDDICGSDSILLKLLILNAGTSDESNYVVELTATGDSNFTYNALVTDTLLSKTRDSVQLLVPIPTQQGMNLVWAAKINLPSDGDTSNNQSSPLAYQVARIPDPVLAFDTLCEGNQVPLRVVNNGQNWITWYDFPSDTAVYAQGEQVLTAVPLFDTTYFYAVAVDSVTGCKSGFKALKVFVKKGLKLELGPDLSYCAQDSVLLAANHPYASYSWVSSVFGTDTMPIIWAQDSGHYMLDVIDSFGCPHSDDIWVSMDDCVWPGDANDDGIANALDILHLALNFKRSGTPRPNASLMWHGQVSSNWGSRLPGIPGLPDRKHADTDGNGLVDFDDTTAIIQNYGRIHLKKGGSVEGQDGDIPVYFRFQNDTAYDEEWVTADLILADSLNPVSVYGISFSLDGIEGVKQGSLQLNVSDSWFISDTDEHLSFAHYLSDSVQLDLALARVDTQNRLGGGKIAQLRFQLVNQGTPIALSLLPYAIHLLDKDGLEIPTYNLPLDTLTALKERAPVIIDGLEEVENTWRIYPNPVKDRLMLDISKGNLNKIFLLDAKGKMIPVQTKQVNGQIELDLHKLVPGLYVLVMDIDGVQFRQKIIKQ